MRKIIISFIFGMSFLSWQSSALTEEGKASELLSIPYYKSVIGETAWNINNLHLINIGDIEGLRSHLHSMIATDAIILFAKVNNPELPKEEVDLIYGVLRLLSIQNEKYPVQEWMDNKELIKVFEGARKQDPEHIKDLRERNWNKPMWVK
ncbi:MAG: hypothetical protein KZQ90_09215 [Candidatus Thiodiazotropha sp. (ex Codakia rugifera)]|nr:hypothetical protein [Candidatus Thiodiazotropha sp. (ex Codakia rugifera)]